MRQQLGRLKQFQVLGKVLLFFLLSAVILVVTSGLTKNANPYLNAGIAAIATLLLTGAFTFFRLQRLRDIGVVPNNKTLSKVSLGFLIGLFMVAIQFVIVFVCGNTTISIAYPDVSTVTFSVLLYFFAGLREELAFRGYPLRTLNNNIGPIAAQLIVCVVFIIEHFIGGMNWWQSILGPGLGAVLFGIAALRSQGIALPFGLHFAWNLGQWLVGFKSDNGTLKITAHPGFEPRADIAGWIGYIIAFALGIILICFWKRITAVK